MLDITTGNILESDAQALVNTVNLDGFMGKGIAYQFKQEYPENNAAYIDACNKKEIEIGKLFVYSEKGKYIFNFPTKKSWREKSDYSYIEKGMESLIQNIQKLGVQSIAIPPLGCGNGGLDWLKVKTIILRNLESLPVSVNIKIYAPSRYYSSTSVTSPIMNFSHILLMVLKENLTRFNKIRLQKAAYFINLLSGTDYFKFKEHKYGPYSHAVDILSRDIREYQQHYKLTTEKAIHHVLRNIISETVNQKINQFGEAIIRASSLVNSIQSDNELEILTNLLWIVQNQSGINSESILKQFHNWPKAEKARFTDDEILLFLEKATSSGMIAKSLLGYELNSSFF
jgi:O-acetyl-ADP-ribose deacetylase (regulator of RNase III)